MRKSSGEPKSIEAEIESSNSEEQEQEQEQEQERGARTNGRCGRSTGGRTAPRRRCQCGSCPVRRLVERFAPG